MAIPQDQMYWRFGDIMLNQNGLYVRWEVYHPTTATVIQAGTVNVPAAKAGDLAVAWSTAQGLINSAVNAVYARHAAVDVIQGYSRFDANLILDSWLSDPVSGTLTHPLSGAFESVVYDGLVGLVNAILDRVPGPPMWAWAEAGDAGRLRVRWGSAKPACERSSAGDSYDRDEPCLSLSFWGPLHLRRRCIADCLPRWCCTKSTVLWSTAAKGRSGRCFAAASVFAGWTASC